MQPRAIDLARYGVLALPLAFAGLPIYLHAPDFYAAGLGVPLAAIGFALLALRIIDAVQDPLIGSLSDRFHAHRRLIILVGMAMLAGGFWLVFHPPAAYPLLWLSLSVLICTTGYSSVTINFNALGSLWVMPADQRTRVTAWREALGLLGLLAATITPPLLMEIYSPAQAFSLMTLAYIPLLLICAVFFWRWLRDADLAPPDDTQTLGFSQVWHSAGARSFFIIYVTSAVASAIPGVLVLFFIRDYLGAESYTGLFLLLYFLSGALAMPLWHRLSVRIGKTAAWQASMVLAVITFIWAFLLGPGAVWPFAVICALSGMAFGGDLALPPAILADHIMARGHTNVASRYYAVLAFMAKGALALATGLTLPLLGMAGYQPGMVSTGLMLPLVYALIPCVIKTISLLWLHRYRRQNIDL